MPAVVSNSGVVGLPGDRYKVSLSLKSNGKYRKVDWVKLPADDLSKAQDFRHAYYVFGGFSNHAFVEMETYEEGTHVAKIQLQAEVAEFKIARDRDWDQLFFPDEGTSGQDAHIVGPSSNCCGQAWKIAGQRGDIFLVTFKRRLTSEEKDEKSMSWSFVANEPFDEEERIKGLTFQIVRCSSQSPQPVEMQPNKDRTVFTGDLVVDDTCAESFQIMQNGCWLSLVHPNTQAANFRDEGHEVQGPDNKGIMKMWVIGNHDEDDTDSGARFRIYLVLEAGRPRRIRWERLREGSEEPGSSEALPSSDDASWHVVPAAAPAAAASDEGSSSTEDSAKVAEDRKEGSSGEGSLDLVVLEDKASAPAANGEHSAASEGSAAEPAALEDQAHEPAALEDRSNAPAALEDRQDSLAALEDWVDASAALEDLPADPAEDRGRRGSPASREDGGHQREAAGS